MKTTIVKANTLRAALVKVYPVSMGLVRRGCCEKGRKYWIYLENPCSFDPVELEGFIRKLNNAKELVLRLNELCLEYRDRQRRDWSDIDLRLYAELILAFLEEDWDEVKKLMSEEEEDV